MPTLTQLRAHSQKQSPRSNAGATTALLLVPIWTTIELYQGSGWMPAVGVGVGGGLGTGMTGAILSGILQASLGDKRSDAVGFPLACLLAGAAAAQWYPSWASVTLALSGLALYWPLLIRERRTIATAPGLSPELQRALAQVPADLQGLPLAALDRALTQWDELAPLLAGSPNGARLLQEGEEGLKALIRQVIVVAQLEKLGGAEDGSLATASARLDELGRALLSMARAAVLLSAGDHQQVMENAQDLCAQAQAKSELDDL